MSTSLRLLLVIGALCALVAVGSRVKKSKILMEDAIFWVVAAVVLVIVAAFPSIAINLAFALGFLSPANFVFLVIIALLLWKVFTNSSELSRLKAKVNELAQEVALAHMDEKASSDAHGNEASEEE